MFESFLLLISLFFTKAIKPSTISPKLCGGMFVAIPTAIPEDPFNNKNGSWAGRTSGSFCEPSKLFEKLTVSDPISSRKAWWAIGANLVSVYLIAAGGSLSTDPKFPCPLRVGYLVEKFCTSLTNAS